jgi:hypothetical protein
VRQRIARIPLGLLADPADRHIRPIQALALAGRTSDARRELSTIEGSLNDDLRVTRGLDLDLARGAVELAELRPRDAIASLTRASGTTRSTSLDACRVCALPWLGRAYEAAGFADSATTVYERYLTTGDPFRLLVDAAWRAVVLRRLGDLHAQRGDTARAVERLSQFVELWKDADRELQPEVEKARRRLDMLRGRLSVVWTSPSSGAGLPHDAQSSPRNPRSRIHALARR